MHTKDKYISKVLRYTLIIRKQDGPFYGANDATVCISQGKSFCPTFPFPSVLKCYHHTGSSHFLDSLVKSETSKWHPRHLPKNGRLCFFIFARQHRVCLLGRSNLLTELFVLSYLAQDATEYHNLL